MEYKTLGTIVYEMTGVMPTVDVTQRLGLLLKQHNELNGHFIYVKEPLRERNKIITTRAYDKEGQEQIHRIIWDIIERQKKSEDYFYIEKYVDKNIPDMFLF